MRLIHLIACMVLALAPLCGETVEPPEPRHVAGGQAADPLLYPFVVRVQASGSVFVFCTGALVSEDWALTAAHCVDGKDARELANFSDICISSVGITHAGTRRDACEIVIHDLYDPFTPIGRAHDLALVRINPYTGRSHKPVILTRSASAPSAGTNTWTAGMATGFDNIIKVAQWPLAACPAGHPAEYLCVQASAGVIVEEGDSGAPLLIQKGGAWEQIGVTVAVNLVTHVIAYADLSRHGDWIRSVTGAENPTVAPPSPTFRPQTVLVALGRSGSVATLMTTEAGGFTLDGEAFETGGEVTAGNGDRYVLTLKDGFWSATLQSAAGRDDSVCVSEAIPAVILEWADGEWTVRLETQP